MIRVKICGITRLEDAMLAISLGADALGFIFYPKSPRYILPEKVKEIIAQLPPYVTTVGVFVNETEEKIKKIVEITGIDMVQLHGEEPPQFCTLFFPRVIKAFRVKTSDDLFNIGEYKNTVRGILLDTFVKGIPGGTGKTFNWRLAQEAKKFDIPLILAGGLCPENVIEAIEKVKPFGIDISSGVESSPGIKDPNKLKALFEALSPFRKSS